MAKGHRIVSLLLVGLFSWVTASAAAAPLPPPGGFRLPASNGYSIRVLTFDGERLGERDSVLLLVTRKDDGAFYAVLKGASVTETTVEADLGRVGSIDLHFVPSGRRRVERSGCDPHPLEFDSGFYEGRIDFEGEEGYAEAHATRARGEIRFAASLVCGSSVDEGAGGRAPGARLTVRRHWRHGRVEFEATKNSPRRPSRFRASIEEKRGNLVIAREVSAEAGSGAFDFDVPAQTAKLGPPPPFSGAARFTRPNDRRGVLHGSLSVDFPGRSNVPLRGSHGALQRWVQNPSHPFRPLLTTRAH